MKYMDQTQAFSTFGDKLLQHTDVLYDIQVNGVFRPITVQLAPTDECDMGCYYCSVKKRNKKMFIPLDVIKRGLHDFKWLGAKSLEITGGGNPLLHPGINEIITYAHNLDMKVGVITNSTNPKDYLTDSSLSILSWIRVSLSGLDTNKVYQLHGIPQSKLGLSYILNKHTTPEIIEKIAEMVKKYNVKFARLAPNCLNDDSLTAKEMWDSIIDEVNDGRMFIKEINDNFKPFPHGCYVGMVRPYWVPKGVYICTSHVLNTQNYDPKYKLCDIENIIEFYAKANTNFQLGIPPYSIDVSKCGHCYYYNNNKILHTVSTLLPDSDFA